MYGLGFKVQGFGACRNPPSAAPCHDFLSAVGLQTNTFDPTGLLSRTQTEEAQIIHLMVTYP